jgi:hypothetical protein
MSVHCPNPRDPFESRSTYPLSAGEPDPDALPGRSTEGPPVVTRGMSMEGGVPTQRLATCEDGGHPPEDFNDESGEAGPHYF